MKLVFGVKVAVACAVLALATYSQAATTTYVRGAAPNWNTAVEDLINGSDSEVGGTSNVWRYEVVDGVAAENGLAGATPWYTLPTSTTEAFVWSAIDLRWDWVAGGVLDTNNDKPAVRAQFILQSSASQYGKVPRVVWLAPEAGKASLAGGLGFQRGSGGTVAVVFEWAMGKKSGTSTYTKLASGETAGVTNAARVNIALAGADLTAMTDVSLAAGEGIWYTIRQKNNALDDKLDNVYDAAANSTLTLSFTPGAVSSVKNWTAR